MVPTVNSSSFILGIATTKEPSMPPPSWVYLILLHDFFELVWNGNFPAFGPGFLFFSQKLHFIHNQTLSSIHSSCTANKDCFNVFLCGPIASVPNVVFNRSNVVTYTFYLDLAGTRSSLPYTGPGVQNSLFVRHRRLLIADLSNEVRNFFYIKMRQNSVNLLCSVIF